MEENKIEELEKEISDMEERIEEIKNEISSLEETREHYTSRETYYRNEEEKGTLEDSYDNIIIKINNGIDENEQKKEQFEKRRDALNAIQRTIKGSNTKIQKRLERQNELQEQIKTLEKEIQELNDNKEKEILKIKKETNGKEFKLINNIKNLEEMKNNSDVLEASDSDSISQLLKKEQEELAELRKIRDNNIASVTEKYDSQIEEKRNEQRKKASELLKDNRSILSAQKAKETVIARHDGMKKKVKVRRKEEKYVNHNEKEGKLDYTLEKAQPNAENELNPKNTDPVKRFDRNDKDENLAEIDRFINEEVERARKAKEAKEAKEARRLKESQKAYARNFKARNGFSIVDKAETMDDPEIMDAEEGKKYFDLDDEESFDREDEKVADASYIDDDKFNSFIEKYKDDCSKAETIEMFNETISIMMEIAETKEIGKEKISDKQHEILIKTIDDMQRTIGKKLYEKSKEENRKEDSADIDENKSESGEPAEKQEKSKAEEEKASDDKKRKNIDINKAVNVIKAEYNKAKNFKEFMEIDYDIQCEIDSIKLMLTTEQYKILKQAIKEMNETLGRKLYEAEEAKKAAQKAQEHHNGSVAGKNYGTGLPIYESATAEMKRRNAAYEASLATPQAQSIPAQPKDTTVITPETSGKAGKKTEEIKDIEIKEHFGEDGKEKKSIKINGIEYELNRKLDEFTEGKINDICKEVLKLEDKMSIIKRIAFNRLKRKVDPAIVNVVKEKIMPAQELKKWTEAIEARSNLKNVSSSIGAQGIEDIAIIREKAEKAEKAQEEALKKFDSTMKQYVEAINSRNPNKLPFKITYDCSGKMSASEYNEISRYIKAANKLGVNIKGRRTFFGLFKARYNKNNALPNGNTPSKTNEGDKSFMNGYDSTGKDDSEVVITVPPRNPGKAKPNQKKSGKAKSSEQNVR